jgi:drug/metabolite transporter (DMT)-like permease
MPKPTRLMAFLTLVLAMCFTGANVPFGKAIVAAIPVPVFLLFRFTVATAVLALLAAREPGPRLTSMSRADLRDLMLLSALGSVGFTIFTLEGVKRTSGTDAGIILATLPAVAALLGVIVRRERPGRWQSAAIVLAVAGLAVVNLRSDAAGLPGRSLTGNMLVALAVLCEATFVLASGRMSAIYRPIRLSFAVSATSLVLCLPAALPALRGFDWQPVPGSVWLLGLWYALAASVFCTILWYRAAAHLETWLAGLATSAVPVAALAVSVLVLGERIRPVQLVGATLVITAIALAARAAARRPAPAIAPAPHLRKD